MLIVLSGIFLVGALAWSVVYALHADLEQSVEGNVLAIHNVSTSTAIVLTEEEDRIAAEVYEKGFFGWSSRDAAGSPALTETENGERFGISNFSVAATDEYGMLFGYRPPGVETIRFKDDEFSTEVSPESHFWVLPVERDRITDSFSPDQFSVIYENEEEVFYPFDE